MFIKELNRLKGSLFNFALLVFYLCFFGKPEKTSSRVAYLIIAVFAVIAFFVDQNYGRKTPAVNAGKKDKYGKTVLYVTGAIFGFIVVLANYELYIDMPSLLRALVMLLLFLSSGVVFDTIFRFVSNFFLNFDIRTEKTNARPVVWFFVCFILLSAAYLTVFFLCSYPGQICSDSLNQIKQVIYGNYSNHHPVFQTWLIGIFFKLGMTLFGEINAAVATYTVFQMLFMSAVFAFLISTLIWAGCKRIFAAALLLWFMLTPCHLIFSFTLWKDSLFGAVVCIFTLALFRIMKDIGKSKVFNYTLLTISAAGFCLLRSNGLPAFILLMVILTVFFLIKKFRIDKTVLICCTGALLASVILKYPVLKAMDIPQAETAEMLSIPVQQISRIALEKDDLTAEELYVINQIAPVERLKEQYNPRVYDYARDVIRYEGDQTYISDHPFQCFCTWLSVVTRHPFTAVRAWVDQTSGYWNPSAYYWMKWWDGVCEEEGLYLHVNSPKADEIFHSYVDMFTTENSILGLSYNVGLLVWVILFMTAYAVYRRKNDFITALPVLTIVATLLIATLMHDEFRFGYPVFTCLPVIVFSCLGYKDTKGQEESS